MCGVLFVIYCVCGKHMCLCVYLSVENKDQHHLRLLSTFVSTEPGWNSSVQLGFLHSELQEPTLFIPYPYQSGCRITPLTSFHMDAGIWRVSTLPYQLNNLPSPCLFSFSWCSPGSPMEPRLTTSLRSSCLWFITSCLWQWFLFGHRCCWNLGILSSIILQVSLIEWPTYL